MEILANHTKSSNILNTITQLLLSEKRCNCEGGGFDFQIAAFAKTIASNTSRVTKVLFNIDGGVIIFMACHFSLFIRN